MLDSALVTVTAIDLDEGRVVRVPAAEAVGNRRYQLMASAGRPIPSRVAAVETVKAMVATGTVDDIKALVMSTPGAVPVALAAELEGKNRKTLLAWLNSFSADSEEEE